MIVEMQHKNGVILKTAGKFCQEDILVSPINQVKKITENGMYSPDDGYSGLSDVIIDVQPELTESSIELTNNGVAEIVTPEKFYGMSKLTVLVNVPIHDTYPNAEGVKF